MLGATKVRKGPPEADQVTLKQTKVSKADRVLLKQTRKPCSQTREPLEAGWRTLKQVRDSLKQVRALKSRLGPLEPEKGFHKVC